MNGMDLLDRFAIAALTGLLSERARSERELARVAYNIAEAMMDEREVRELQITLNKEYDEHVSTAACTHPSSATAAANNSVVGVVTRRSVGR